MTAPLVLTDVIPADCSLWLAVVIGIGMGFFLERAGFGSAKKLAAQFYLYDMAVFKVMGTAVLTSMVGIFLLSATCFLDLGQVTFVGTFVWPQVVGGLILGIGFVVGGYCPGTSLVACASGKLDGMVFTGGLIAGMFIYGGMYPSVECFADSSSLGKQTLYGFFNIPYAAAVLLVIVLAAVGFRIATILEKKYAHLKPQDQPPE